MNPLQLFGDEACYSQQSERFEPVEGVNRNAADLVVTQDAGKQTGMFGVISL